MFEAWKSWKLALTSQPIGGWHEQKVKNLEVFPFLPTSSMLVYEMHDIVVITSNDRTVESIDFATHSMCCLSGI